LLCPKKLSHNWVRYLKNHGSLFEEDRLDYAVRYHTDLQDNRLESNHTDGLKLDEAEQAALVVFLETLTDPRFVDSEEE
jgi:hypothetical protein